MTRTTTERDESAWSAATTPQMSRRDMLAERYEPHGDDLLPPAAHLMPAPGVDVLAVFAAEVEAAREAVANLCNECNRTTHEDDAAPSCGSHRVCVPCYETSDFRCRECRRVWTEVDL